MPEEKTKEEIKVETQRLGAEYRQSCYNEKSAEGCYQLGDFLESVKGDFPKAAGVHKSNCNDLKFGKSCFKFGSYMLAGKGRKVNLEESCSYYSKGCELGNPEACFGLGLVLSSDKFDYKKDFKKALEHFDKGCRGNDRGSCFYASGILMKGMEHVPQDLGRAFEYAKRACELNHAQGCANLSQMYKQGDGVAKNEELATKYRKLAVELQKQFKEHFHTLGFAKTS